MQSHILQTNSFEETQQEGFAFAKQLNAGDVILLFGELGSGKTTFVQGLAKGLGVQRRIISPTFIILRRYETSAKYFYHIDLYRTKNEDDLKGLGLPEILAEKDSITVIEWPEKLGTLMPKKAWEIYFDTIDDNTREITVGRF